MLTQMGISSRTIGGRKKIDPKTGAVQHELMEVPRQGYVVTTAQDRLSKFRTVKASVDLKQEKKRNANPSKVFIDSLDLAVVQSDDERERRKNAAEASKHLNTAIKEAMIKKMTETPKAFSLRQSPFVTPTSPAFKRHTKPQSYGSVAGDLCNQAQVRLAHPEARTGVHKHKELPNRLFNGQGDVSRQFPDKHVKVMLALTNTMSGGHHGLTIPGRAADFRTEVDWRMKLRPYSRM